MESLSNLHKLISHLIPMLMAGGGEKLGQNGSTYLKQLCRLVDKAVLEYEWARELFLKDQSDSESFYMFGVMGHFENCINATRRAIKFVQKVRAEESCPPLSRTAANCLQANSGKIVDLRDSIEHFDERVQEEQGPVLLVFDNKKGRLYLGSQELEISELVGTIKRLHSISQDLISSLSQ